MASPCLVYVFGDQTSPLESRLESVCRCYGSPMLALFIAQAFSCVQTEIELLPTHVRLDYPRAFTLDDIPSWEKDRIAQLPALQGSLTCICQLAEFIRSIDETGKSYPDVANTAVYGLCTGALSAAAVSSSNSLTELLPVALHVVGIAFHVGLLATTCRRMISGRPGQWSIVVSGISTESERQSIRSSLQSLIVLHKLSATHVPYISAEMLDSVTISGPPQTLDLLRNFSEFSGLRMLPIPVHAPYHASHLFTESDVSRVLHASSVGANTTSLPHSPSMISCSSGVLATKPESLKLRIECALKHILLEPLHLRKLADRLLEVAALHNTTELNLIPVGTSTMPAILTAVECLTSALDCHILPLPQRESHLESGSRLLPSFAVRPQRSKIAIIGMSGRYPSANDNSEFWDLLLQGLDVHQSAPASRWDVKTHVDPTGARKNTSATGFGCWLEHPEAFDAQFFNITPREAPQIDPAQRIALMTAYEAIEQAGIVPDATPSTKKDRVGVFYGVTSNDWMETNSAQNIDAYFIPGGNRAFIPGRINYFFKFSGPSASVDTACSSSLAAIHVACNSLWMGDVDTAIAGGTNVLTNPDFTAGLDRGHFLSRTGNCKTFDNAADGYCRGEGVGTVILKRLEDATADNDPIQAVILGAYTNHSAEAESITRPHVGAQKAIFSKILKDADVNPRSVSYVEMHGTGTQPGDLGEMNSVLSIFAPDTTFRAEHPLYVGSAKANIGHGEAASGITSLAKVLLMMHNNVIPPHCGIKSTINSKFPKDLAERNVRIAKEPTPWNGSSLAPRRAFVNNFSAAGGNSALLLEAAEMGKAITIPDVRACHVVAVTARHPSSLERNVKSLLVYLRKYSDGLHIGQLSYTTTARRIHHPYRIMVKGSNVAEIQDRLQQAVSNGIASNQRTHAFKLTFAFSGQGAQYPGMSKHLYSSIQFYQDAVNRFSQLGQTFGFPPVLSYLTGERTQHECSTVVTQLATVITEIALFHLWKSWGIMPNAVMGHSLGEFAALNAAGVLTDAETIYLVGRRAQLLETHCTPGSYAMLAVKADPSAIRQACCGLSYEVCCFNGFHETVIGAKAQIVTVLEERLHENRIFSAIVRVPFAFHTSQVDAILDDLDSELQHVALGTPVLPIISTVSGSIIPAGSDLDRSYLRSQCRQSVHFVGALDSAQREGLFSGAAMVLEIGPHCILSRLIRAHIGSEIIVSPTLQRNQNDWTAVGNAVQNLYCIGADLDWHEYHRVFTCSHTVLQLPSYSWNLRDYWMQYTNDWSLRKGDPPFVISAKPSPVSSSIHSVIEENAGRMVVESDLGNPAISCLIQGHVVDDVPVCTPSVYADIVLTIGDYMLAQYHPELTDVQLDVSEMTIQKALIAAPDVSRIMRTTVEVDWTMKEARFSFATFDQKGRPSHIHAQATLRFTDNSLLTELRKSACKTRARMAHLESSLTSRNTQRFNHVMIYKMIQPLARFHQNYKTLDEVILDTSTLESASRITLRDVCLDGIHHTHPGIIDGLTQSAGFIMNCNDANDLDVEVFVSHGWDRFQMFQKIDPSKSYTSYVRLAEGKNRIFQGDLVVFDGDEIAACYMGIHMQGVSRDVLRRILQFEARQQTNNVTGTKSSKGENAKSTSSSASPPMKNSPKLAVQLVTTTPDAISLHDTSTIHAAAKETLEPGLNEQASSLPVSQTVSLVVSPKWDRVQTIIAEESGLSLEDVDQTIDWSDLGIDSLLILTITSRFREEFDIDLDMSDLLSTYRTISSLKDFFGEAGEREIKADDDVVTANMTPPRHELEQFRKSKGDPVSCPTDHEKSADDVFAEAARDIVGTNNADKLPSNMAIQRSIHSFQGVLGVISDVTGLPERDLGDDASFACLGIDSLMSLMIRSRLQEEMNLDLTQEDFFHLATIGDLRESLTRDSETSSATVSVTSEGSGHTSDTSQPTLEIPEASNSGVVPSATSVVLQGCLETAQRILFLFPDGAGSATSYSSIPPVSSDAVLIGLNSPYYRNPSEFKCNIDDLVDSYLREIYRRQPDGHFHFAGWSAGGILAYHATYRAIKAGWPMQSLILIDSPVPRGLDKIPDHFYEFLSRHHVFGHATLAGSEAPPPAWLFPHFNATIDTLHEYVAAPLPPSQAPQTCILWAGESVLEGLNETLAPHPDDTEGMKFLTRRHDSFEGAGWETLVPKVKLRTSVAHGANHFSMMKDRYALRLGTFLYESLA